MDEKPLVIGEFTGIGYQTAMVFSTWRVAMSNCVDEIHPEQIGFIERHNETDKVFVMNKGQGILFLDGDDGKVLDIQSQVMEPGKTYNIKQGVWHTVVLRRDGSGLIVENQNTVEANSNYFSLGPEQRALLIAFVRHEQTDRQ